MDNIYVGDVGVLVKVDVGQDISSSSIHTINVVYPDGTIANWSASINGNFLEYITVAGDLDIAGRYKIQAYIEMGVYKGYGDTDILIISKRGV